MRAPRAGLQTRAAYRYLAGSPAAPVWSALPADAVPVFADPAGAPPNVGSPTANDVLYLTDGLAVYAVTVSATGLIQLWRTNATGTPTWALQ